MCVLCVHVSTHQCLSVSVSTLISCVFEIRPRCYTFCFSDPRKHTAVLLSIPLSLTFCLLLLLLSTLPSFSSLSAFWVNECTTNCSSVLKHTMHGIIHCIATSLLCLHTLACWPCLAGGRAHISLWYIFFIFKDKLFHFFASPHFPGAYHPPLPHHPSRFFSFQVLWQLKAIFFLSSPFEIDSLSMYLQIVLPHSAHKSLHYQLFKRTHSASLNHSCSLYYAFIMNSTCKYTYQHQCQLCSETCWPAYLDSILIPEKAIPKFTATSWVHPSPSKFIQDGNQEKCYI